jgi:hypothetical protein
MSLPNWNRSSGARRRQALARWWPCVAAAALALACNDVPTAPAPAQLVLVQAPSAAGAPGATLADTLKVRLQTANGTSRSGVRVSWQVATGGGSVTPVSDTTDANGVAAATWTLGIRPGVNEVQASTLGDSTVTFQATGEAFRVDKLSADWRLACGLVSGALWCWGNYFWANAPPVSVYPSALPWDIVSPALVDDTHGFIDLAVNGYVVCALDHQLAVWCANGDAPALTQVAGLPPIHGGMAGAGYGFCALAEADMSAWCWGIGLPSLQIPDSPPVRLQSSPSFLRIWMGEFDIISCGLLTDGTAACWGAGPLGDGTTNSSVVPVAVGGGRRFVELGVARGFACGRTSTGEIWCWGSTTAAPGTTMLQPTLVKTGTTLLAAQDNWVITSGVATGLERWFGLSFEAEPAEGLSGIPVRDFGQQGMACAHLAGGEVYCNEEMWNRWSGLYYRIYHAVPPAYRAPAEAGTR